MFSTHSQLAIIISPVIRVLYVLSMSTTEESHHLDITLSEDACTLLTRLQQVGGFESQSQTLEELLFAIDDLTTYIINIMELVPTGEVVTEDMIRNTILMIALRLQKFGLWDAVEQHLANQKNTRAYY